MSVLFSFNQSCLYITCDLIYVIHGNKITVIVIVIVCLNCVYFSRQRYHYYLSLDSSVFRSTRPGGFRSNFRGRKCLPANYCIRITLGAPRNVEAYLWTRWMTHAKWCCGVIRNHHYAMNHLKSQLMAHRWSWYGNKTYLLSFHTIYGTIWFCFPIPNHHPNSIAHKTVSNEHFACTFLLCEWLQPYSSQFLSKSWPANTSITGSGIIA